MLNLIGDSLVTRGGPIEEGQDTGDRTDQRWLLLVRIFVSLTTILELTCVILLEGAALHFIRMPLILTIMFKFAHEVHWVSSVFISVLKRKRIVFNHAAEGLYN